MSSSTKFLTFPFLVNALINIGLVNGLSFTSGPTSLNSGKDVTGSVFGTTNDKLFPVAFADFNSDRATDLIVISRDRSSLYVLKSGVDAPYLTKGSRCTIRTNKNRTVEIVGVVPGDFNGDGLLDMAVTIQQFGTKEREVAVLKGSLTEFCRVSGDLIRMVQEPMATDLNGDMVMDFIGEVYGKEEKEIDGKLGCVRKIYRKVWLFNPSKKKPLEVPFRVINGTKHITEGFRAMASPSANAFVDIDGDNIPELLLVTEVEWKDQAENKLFNNTKYVVETYSVVVNESDACVPLSFTRKSTDIPLNVNGTRVVGTVGQPLFLDLTRSGNLVHLIPYCTGGNCKGNSESGLLAVVNGSVVDIPLLNFDYDGKQWKWKYTGYSGLKSRLPFDSFYSRTITLRVGDYNLDGYPDLIGVVVAERQGNGVSESRAVILENVPCNVTYNVTCTFSRTFRARFDLLQDYGSVAMATFYDFNDNGFIDVLLVIRMAGKYEVRAFEGNPDDDSTFLKAMVLSGRKCSKCPRSGTPYGNVIAGPVLRYHTKTGSRKSKTSVAAQNYRSSHLPMDLPYTIFGLGASSDAIDSLTVEMRLPGSGTSSWEWSHILPNSEVVVIPPQSSKTGSWKSEIRSEVKVKEAGHTFLRWKNEGMTLKAPAFLTYLLMIFTHAIVFLM